MPSMPSMPPVPPVPAVPAIPALPALARTAQSGLPAVAAEVHAACANAKPGTKITWHARQGMTMSGRCEQVNGKMMFRLHHFSQAG
jgi:hypothetical protein